MPDSVSAGLRGGGRLLVAFSVVLALVAAVPRVASTGVPTASPPSPSAGRDVAAMHFGGRVKRQLPPIEQGNQVIDNIFQVSASVTNVRVMNNHNTYIYIYTYYIQSKLDNSKTFIARLFFFFFFGSLKCLLKLYLKYLT